MLLPHIVGGVIPPGLVTENVSVRQAVALVEATPMSVVTDLVVVAVEVEGPVKTMESKSRLNCKQKWVHGG